MTTMTQPMQVLTSQGTDEWYTPPRYIDLARRVLGGIDLDPASAAIPQAWIQARTFYTKEDNGLNMLWFGRVFLNPPFTDAQVWCNRLQYEYTRGDVTSAILLINSNLGYKWYEQLWTRWPVCCARERICFIKADGTPGGQAKRGQTFVYFGQDYPAFIEAFRPIGRVLLP
jgi:hypothetical protein